MLRSHQRLVDYAEGKGVSGSAPVRDALFHFFVDAYHLKDWIKNDPATNRFGTDVETETGKHPLNLCADICNGVKHLELTKARTGDLTTAVKTQSVTVHVGSHSEHSWTVESAGRTSGRVLDLAVEIVTAWDTWLKSKSLL